MITENNKIKNIIFDFGGVILDIDIKKSVDAFASIGINNIAADDIHPNTRSFFIDLEIGKITTKDFFEHILNNYPTTRAVTQRELFEAWSALLLPFKKERVDLVKSLKEKGYNLYLLSNTNYPHRVRFFNNYTRQFGTDLESLFIDCYYSDELGMRKPDADIYKYVIEKSKLEPSETIFIDDNLINLSGAKECGLNTYHLKATQGETILDIFQ